MLTQRNTIALTFCLLSSLTVGAQNQPPAKRAGTIVPLPRDLEIQLALSALPAHLRDHATVYALNPAKGFEVARTGTNGFSALVARTGDDAMRGPWPLTAYPDDVLYPLSEEQAGTMGQLRALVDNPGMHVKRMPRQDRGKINTQRKKTHENQAPG